MDEMRYRLTFADSLNALLMGGKSKQMEWRYTESQVVGKWAVFELLKHFGVEWKFDKEINIKTFGHRDDLRAHTVEYGKNYITVYLRKCDVHYGDYLFGCWQATTATVCLSGAFLDREEGIVEGCYFLYDSEGYDVVAIKKSRAGSGRGNPWSIRKRGAKNKDE